MSYMKYLISIPILILVLSGCSAKKTALARKDPPHFCLDKTFKTKIEFQQAKKQRLTEIIPLTGSVEPNPDKVVHFVSLVGGIISNTYFSLGDKVTKGQILADIQSTELSTLYSELQTNVSRIKVAETKLNSIRSMFEDGVSSQKDLMEAKSELDILLAEKQKIEASLLLYSANNNKNVFQIKSPAAGIITDKHLSSGSRISENGERLFTVSDLREVWIMVNVYASNVQHIQNGMEVKISTLSYPGEIFKGKVAAISQVFDQEARVLKAKVVMQNTDLKLKPGMLVDVSAEKQANLDVISIPTSSMIFDDDQYFVVVYKNDCDIQIRKIAIISKNNGTTYVSNGLAENEQVISKNQLLIYDQIKNLQQ